MRNALPRLSGVGGNGLKMLLISNVVLLATVGTTLLPALLRVLWVALKTPVAPEARDHILVLGVKLKACRLRQDYLQRLERARVLLQDGGGRCIVLLGGHTSRHCSSEAAAGRDFLLLNGVAAEAIQLEERSRHTLENLRCVREQLGEGMDSIILTNRYHLARTAALAKGLSLRYVLCAAEERLSPHPLMLLKLLLEAYYLHWYYSGAVWARLVKDRESLERIS
jgi:uncharacterized SAM-binding protein YcdF (DUF218 family)